MLPHHLLTTVTFVKLFQIIQITIPSIDLIPDIYCTYESIKIYEGDEITPFNLQDNKIFCGLIPPCPFVSQSNSLIVVLQVFDLSNFGGFSLEFKEVATDYRLPNTCKTGMLTFVNLQILYKN